MRALIALAVTLAACSGGNADTATPDTDGGDTSADEGHPLVPEKYKLYWNVDGCTTTDDKPGTQAYVLAEDVRADASGRFTATERWYHFRGTGNYADDCVDEWEIEGSFVSFDYGQLSCSQCEEAYQVTRTLTNATCGITYYSIFGLEDEPRVEVYDAIALFDTLTPSGNPNVDNAMLVIWGSEVKDRSYMMDIDYARGHAFPDDAPGYPSSYDWLGDKCLGSKE
jgi:hypothetical protein